MKSANWAGRFLIIGVLWMGFASPTLADDPVGGPWGSCLYSNSINDMLVRLDPATSEVGDEIVFAPGTPRQLGYFDFQYWGWNTANPLAFAGTVECRIRFYENTGVEFNGYPTPSVNPFYDSGWFGGFGPTGPTPGYRATIYFMAGADWASAGITVPDEMTWSVQFRGMGGTDTVGVDLFSPPTVGENYPDYWKNLGDEYTPDWKLMTNSVPLDFGARFYAVPEPSFLGLSLVGGLGILILVRRLRETA